MKIDGKKNNTTIYEFFRCLLERSFIVVLIFWNYIFEFIHIIKNVKKDTKKYHLTSFSILYNTLLKYPLLGFQPSAYFMYHLYENSFLEYLTLFEEANCVSKKNNHQPLLLDNKLQFKRHLPDSLHTPKLIAYSDSFHKRIIYVSNPRTDQVVIKPIAGKGGYGIVFVSAQNLTEAVQRFNKRCIVEECIEQHIDLNAIFSGSINTVRVLTVKRGNEPEILSVILRVGRTTTHHVDNIAQGGICIGVDASSGVLGAGYTFYKYGHCRYTSHPDTAYIFQGKKIPFFDDVKALACTAHASFPKFVIIGWDIAVTPSGPVLIEGNRIPDLSLHQIFKPLKRTLASVIY